jgi:2,4-dienoyl-CoA reductase-like NADH-dependent reductase (Old Yellow Enzyme family)
MSDDYPLLFEPIDIGPLEIKNRIYHSPVTLNYVDRRTGFPTEELAYYYAERARSGIGLIIQGAMDVSPASEYWPVPNLSMYDENIVPSLRDVVDRVHNFGAKIIVEMFHVGQASNTRRYGKPSVAPSAVPSVVAGTTPKIMEAEDIAFAIEGFVRSTINARDAGYDGVELHGTHSYLLGQFLSPFFNQREDEYGGSVENRMRFLRETIQQCRAEVDDDFVIGLRLVGDELLPGGLTIEDTTDIARRLEDDGLLDFLDIDIGAHQNYHVTMSPMYGAPNFNVPLSAAVREAVDAIPILCAPGRLIDPGQAETVLQDGHADMVGLGRALVSDPDWVTKVREGRTDDIRHCVYCNQYTMGNLFNGLPVGCIQNPAVGREKVFGADTLVPAETPKNVAVIGGGPAGMEAARVAALRGHRVTLYEKGDALGGQVLLAAKLPRRDEIEGVVRWLSLQMEKSGVVVKTGVEMTVDEVSASDVDTVIVATGGRYLETGFSGIMPQEIAGWDTAGSVVTPEAILSGQAETGLSIVILDTDGHVTAPGLAERLASQGAEVTLVTCLASIGPRLVEEMNFPHVYGQLLALGVTFRVNSWAAQIRQGEIDIFNMYAPTQIETLPADTVVMAAARSATDELYLGLKDRMSDVHRVGDCVAPGDIGTAVLSGHRMGRDI